MFSDIIYISFMSPLKELTNGMVRGSADTGGLLCDGYVDAQPSALPL